VRRAAGPDDVHRQKWNNCELQTTETACIDREKLPAPGQAKRAFVERTACSSLHKNFETNKKPLRCITEGARKHRFFENLRSGETSGPELETVQTFARGGFVTMHRLERLIHH
jgi:hypothetical protein